MKTMTEAGSSKSVQLGGPGGEKPGLPTIDVQEYGGRRDGERQRMDRRLFMQLLVFDAKAESIADDVARERGPSRVWIQRNKGRSYASTRPSAWRTDSKSSRTTYGWRVTVSMATTTNSSSASWVVICTHCHT